jgi:hypothetical protein
MVIWRFGKHDFIVHVNRGNDFPSISSFLPQSLFLEEIQGVYLVSGLQGRLAMDAGCHCPSRWHAFTYRSMQVMVANSSSQL